jgi:DNA-directed RNA polymerase beta subunit
MDILNVNNLYKILKLSAIEGKLKQALATGNFAVQGLGSAASMSNATKVGVSQVLARMSYAATLSHLRRIQTPVEKSGKLLAPRKLHGTSWGFMCPVETPEGHSVGIVKNMSLLTSISQHTPSATILHYLQELGNVEWIDTPRVYEGTSVTVNGVIVGYTKDPHGLVTGATVNEQQAVRIVQEKLGWELSKNGRLEFDHMQEREGRNYLVVHGYELVIDDPANGTGHTATWGWYYVDAVTGAAFRWDLAGDKLIPIKKLKFN